MCHVSFGKDSIEAKKANTMSVISLCSPVHVNNRTFRNDNRTNHISFVKNFKITFFCNHVRLCRLGRLEMREV